MPDETPAEAEREKDDEGTGGPGDAIRLDHAALDPAWQRVRRVDLASGEFGERTRTQQGGLAITANLTRTGVFHYQQPDGTVRRELRPAEEVFHPDSLKTLAGATLTDDHPQKVHPGNYKRETIGHVNGVPHRAGKFVQGTVHVQHDDAIDKASRGKLSELSCGYDCVLEPKSGEHEGEPYDAIQRNIRYNHVAAGPPGWGRAGPEVRMHLDGGAGVSGGDRYVRDMPTQEDLDKAVAAARADADKRLGDIEKTLATLTTENSRLAGENAAHREKTQKADKAQSDVESQKRADAEFDAHLEALEMAKGILGPEWSRKREDGSRKSLTDIHCDILGKLKPKMSLDGKDAVYIAGACAVAVEDAEANAEGLRAMQDATHLDGMGLRGDAFGGKKAPPFGKKGAAAGGDDDGDEDDEGQATEDAQIRMVARQKDAWKIPKKDRKRMDVAGMGYSGQGAMNGGNRGNGAGSLGGQGGF